MALKAVLFDVDFTLVKPGPDLGPDGYQLLGRRFGLELDPALYAEARVAAIETIERNPELDHDEEVWVLFTERIIRGMGGDSDRAYECAVEMTRGWEQAANFELFEDTLPVLAELRAHGLKIGLVSNTGRDLVAFVAHHALDVDAALGSATHGKTKPHPTIFQAALDELGVSADAGRDGGRLARGRHRGRPRAGDACVPRRPRRPLPGGRRPSPRPARAAGGARSQRQVGSARRLSPKPQTCSSTT